MAKLNTLLAVAAGATVWAAHHVAGSSSPGGNDLQNLKQQLSSCASVYYPGSTGFENATTRWSVLDEPKVNVVVSPCTENDVAEAVKYANKQGLPFLVYNGVHGALVSLGKMTHGVGIAMNQLSSVQVAEDGKTATMGGGTMSKVVTDKLWAAGKQTVTGTCECVSLLGPALGGGHGWLQGHHGLVADQFVSMNVVLANGTLTTIDSNSDLFWAMKGAGHNFGIVTSLTSKIYDIEHTDWAIETIIFSGDKVEAVYQAANDYLVKNGTQPADVSNWSYWMNNPDADPHNPVIVFYIIQEGVQAVDPVYTEPFHNLGPISVTPQSGTYKDLANWTGIALESPPCQKVGMANPRFPIYLESYNITAQKKAWDLYAPAVRGSSPFNNSIFMFEGYPVEGVHDVAASSSAFAFRSENLLAAPLINYIPAGDLAEEAAQLGNQLRDTLWAATGRKDFRAYINYAYGNETFEQIYGAEKWRQDRLHFLKKKYDPENKFGFYAPIV
ncbi:hypothetical protein N7468_006124 [Penicillium chermesinum]|uniref:FAD-binding PCMH-type domain-containing protein n=1 Tax=Penicillium chermesinum TaxID=63820 RepID=A0A9W9TP56_9EURO|nr:uncharacterized protein N7468_006124 [Penicillium chermesinum]KAJ5233168.1 hypothetical protein N7468_006124 [Penicillium chermesinum]